MENKTIDEKDSEYVYENGFKPKEVNLKDDYKLYKDSFFFWFINKITVILTKLFLIIPKHLFFGYKVIGKKNIKNIKGSIIVSNHTFPLDAFSILTTFWTKKIYTTTLESNLGFGLVSTYFRMGGGVPIPTKPNLFKKFLKDTKNALNSDKNILIFPEAMLMPYPDHIRKFKPGAFHFALDGKNIIIILHTFHKPKGIYKLTRRKKPCIHLNILKPYKVELLDNKKETINKIQDDIFNIMSNYFNENSDYFK